MSPTPIRDPNWPPDPNELRPIPDEQHPAGQDLNPHNPVTPGPPGPPDAVDPDPPWEPGGGKPPWAGGGPAEKEPTVMPAAKEKGKEQEQPAPKQPDPKDAKHKK
jgi:hypothetical protein